MLAQDNMKMGIDAHIAQSFCLGLVMVFFFPGCTMSLANLRSQTRDQTQGPTVEVPNHWTTRKVP